MDAAVSRARGAARDRARAALIPIAVLGASACRAPQPAASGARAPLVELDATTTDRPGPGFVLDAALRVRRIQPGQPDTLLELGNGAIVIDGDRLQLHLRTAQDAYLYLAFCSQHAADPRYPGLTVFPDHGAVHVRAYRPTIAPDPEAEIALDDHPGRETLYVILSRRALERADANLARAIASARQGDPLDDCGAPFRPAAAAPAPRPGPGRRWSGGGRFPAATAGKRPESGRTAPSDEPIVEIQRGGDIVWNDSGASLEADAAGIVVLRYVLTHVARRALGAGSAIAPDRPAPPR